MSRSDNFVNSTASSAKGMEATERSASQPVLSTGSAAGFSRGGGVGNSGVEASVVAVTMPDVVEEAPVQVEEVAPSVSAAPLADSLTADGKSVMEEISRGSGLEGLSVAATEADMGGVVSSSTFVVEDEGVLNAAPVSTASELDDATPPSVAVESSVGEDVSVDATDLSGASVAADAVDLDASIPAVSGASVEADVSVPAEVTKSDDTPPSVAVELGGASDVVVDMDLGVPISAVAPIPDEVASAPAVEGVDVPSSGVDVALGGAVESPDVAVARVGRVPAGQQTTPVAEAAMMKQAVEFSAKLRPLIKISGFDRSSNFDKLSGYIDARDTAGLQTYLGSQECKDAGEKDTSTGVFAAVVRSVLSDTAITGPTGKMDKLSGIRDGFKYLKEDFASRDQGKNVEYEAENIAIACASFDDRSREAGVQFLRDNMAAQEAAKAKGAAKKTDPKKEGSDIDWGDWKTKLSRGGMQMAALACLFVPGGVFLTVGILATLPEKKKEEQKEQQDMEADALAAARGGPPKSGLGKYMTSEEAALVGRKGSSAVSAPALSSPAAASGVSAPAVSGPASARSKGSPTVSAPATSSPAVASGASALAVGAFDGVVAAAGDSAKKASAPVASSPSVASGVSAPAVSGPAKDGTDIGAVGSALSDVVANENNAIKNTAETLSRLRQALGEATHSDVAIVPTISEPAVSSPAVGADMSAPSPDVASLDSALDASVPVTTLDRSELSPAAESKPLAEEVDEVADTAVPGVDDLTSVVSAEPALEAATSASEADGIVEDLVEPLGATGNMEAAIGEATRVVGDGLSGLREGGSSDAVTAIADGRSADNDLSR